MYFKKPSKGETIITACVFVWILFVNILAAVMGLSSWPMFFVTIFFFALGADMKNIPNIFAGGTLGLVSAFLLAKGLAALTPAVGAMGAFSLLITILLAVIILGGLVAPVACNNMAFAYLTAACINIGNISLESIVNNLLMLWIGGAVILGVALLFAQIGTKIVARRKDPSL